MIQRAYHTLLKDQPAQFIDQATGEATEAKEIPTKRLYRKETVGKYTIDPLTGVVTFTQTKTSQEHQCLRQLK